MDTKPRSGSGKYYYNAPHTGTRTHTTRSSEKIQNLYKQQAKTYINNTYSAKKDTTLSGPSKKN
jgi:hypothetical protein